MKNKNVCKLCCAAAVATIAVSCTKDEHKYIPVVEPKISHSTKKKVSTISVPVSVKGKWSSVTISVLNKQTMNQKSYRINIGGELQLPGSSMIMVVEEFLPSFIMNGSVITSRSNELRNPAAKVKITDDKGVIVFDGWLFSRHQNSHLPINPNYGFALEDATPK